MGSDNLFHKRRAIDKKQSSRKRNNRAGKPRFLIVTEGKKTEPFYFKALCDDIRIQADVEITPGELGNTPGKIVTYAKKLYDDDKNLGDTYDEVFCVFDKDKHPCFKDAVSQIKDLGKHFTAITSTPCFEYWLLLHFEDTCKPFEKKAIKAAVMH